jgi:DNA-binding NtrC family response regulator
MFTRNLPINPDMIQISEFMPGKTRVLVVDDDDDLRLTLCEFLESCHFAVSSARNGAEAIDMLQIQRHTFDIIFADLMMPPGPSGLDVLKVAQQIHPPTHVVVMTGYSSIETAIECIRCGAYDYLAKPFQLEEIEIVANRIIEHLCLLNDNKRLSRKLASLSETSTTIDARLERIESLLSKITANL